MNMNELDKNTFSEGDSLYCSQDQEKQFKRYNSNELFEGRNEIEINHKGELYRIRITRNGKLIMNK